MASKIVNVLIFGCLCSGCPNSFDVRAAESDAGMPACTLTAGFPCQLGAGAPSCCPSGFVCSDQPMWFPERATCCSSNVGQPCSLKAECCGHLQCVGGRCINPQSNTSCNPVELNNNLCPSDAPRCILSVDISVPSCFAAGGNISEGSPCFGPYACEVGAGCLDGVCRRFCNLGSPVCRAPTSTCAGIGLTSFGFCVP